MIKLRTFALVAVLAAAGVSFAQAESAVTGTWNYKVGDSSAACTLTLTANNSAASGDIASSEGCTGGLSSVVHWRTSGSYLNFISPSGDLVVVLHPEGDAFVGKQIEGGRKVALSR